MVFVISLVEIFNGFDWCIKIYVIGIDCKGFIVYVNSWGYILLYLCNILWIVVVVV